MTIGTRVAICFLLGMLAGCSFALPDAGDGKTLFVLEDDSQQKVSVGPTIPADLMVRDAVSSPFLDSQRIVFSPGEGRRGFFQLAKWTESPVRRFSRLVAERIESLSLFNSVTNQASGALAEFALSLEILDFYYDYDSRPGSVRFRVRGELVRLTDRELIASKLFDVAVPVESESASGAVRASNIAVGQVIDHMIPWLEEASRGALARDREPPRTRVGEHIANDE
ncbi:MAG: membrane integrity-associated transporter subunit PqiC [Bdellovibrionales bacterium]|nr:membrane integrity-associated transporter subunit PqiC [Bdellovibrionales bacterium]